MIHVALIQIFPVFVSLLGCSLIRKPFPALFYCPSHTASLQHCLSPSLGSLFPFSRSPSTFDLTEHLHFKVQSLELHTQMLTNILLLRLSLGLPESTFSICRMERIPLRFKTAVSMLHGYLSAFKTVVSPLGNSHFFEECLSWWSSGTVSGTWPGDHWWS